MTRSGFLWKRAVKSGRNWKRRYFVLTGAGPNGSELRYFENESCSPRELLGSIPITSESHVVNISSAAPPTLRYTGARHDERHMFSLSFTIARKICWSFRAQIWRQFLVWAIAWVGTHS